MDVTYDTGRQFIVPARRNNHFQPFPNVHHDGNRMDTQPTNIDGVLFVLYLPSKYEARIQHTSASLSDHRHGNEI
ncbi:hypothetical protein A9F13_16g01375 [Clavispora lusitaniae]|uniref:Uncharacterized protein n=1 Tax=Clavispora lusitaniae TaxID=36911 RepID=A0AA91PWN7_CLALS|nr:hypothetical protein A9F13_16g01375 [Clavispora lusitaniae]